MIVASATIRQPENRVLRSCATGIGAVYGPAVTSLAPVSPDRVDAVVFDMGGVFAVPAPAPMSELMAAGGVRFELDDSSARVAHYAGVAALTAALVDGAVHETNPAVWEHYDRAYFASTGLRGTALDEAVAARTAARVDGFDTAVIWSHVLVENRAAFARIARLRPTAIVTNNNGTAVQQCLDMRICQVGDGDLPSVAAIVDSGVVGVAKPDPAIFAPALDALGTAADRTLYVGDTVHADVHGATAAGMPVVQLDPYDHHAHFDHWRLPDVVALAEHLAT